MKALVSYDSTHRNTEKIAQVIGEDIAGQVLLEIEVNPADLNKFDLLILGSPIHGGWSTKRVRDLLKTAEIYWRLRKVFLSSMHPRPTHGRRA